MTQSGLTLQNSAIFCRLASSSGSSTRAMMIFGMMPTLCSSLTECCVGFVLCSPLDLMYGTSVTWMNRQFSRPASMLTWRMASRNGVDSMSPVVPPISVITMSASVFFPTE